MFFSRAYVGAAGYNSRISVYRSTAQNLVYVTFTKLLFDAENYDILNEYDATTTHVFKAQAAGFYHIDTVCRMEGGANGETMEMRVVKNASTTVLNSLVKQGDIGVGSIRCSGDLQLVKDDTLEVQVYHNKDSDKNSGSGVSCMMNIHRFA